jgi:hypothetical protein
LFQFPDRKQVVVDESKKSMIITEMATIVLTGATDPYGGLISAAIAALTTGGSIDATAAGVASVAQGMINSGNNPITIDLTGLLYQVEC